MASQGRFAARLARLPHDTLAELAASLCCTNDATRRTADSTLALHDPTPAWAIERILTSPDLVLCIFAHVELQDGVAAATCKACVAKAQLWYVVYVVPMAEHDPNHS